MHFGGAYEDEIVGKAYDGRLMARFVRYVLPYRWLAVAALCLLPLSAAARLAQPWIMKVAIDEHIVTGRMEGLPLVAAGFLALILVESLLTFFEVWLLQYLGQKVMFDLRIELFSHVQRLPVSFFDRTPTGSLVTRLTSDVEVLGEMFAAGIITVVGDILFLAGIVGVMLWMNLKLSLVTFAVLPVLIWVAFTFRVRMRKAFREVRARLANLNTFLAETIGGMAVVQLFNRQETERREFSRFNAAYRDANLPVITWDASLYALVETLSSIAVGLIIWYGGGEIVGGALTFGALVAFIQYTEKFFGPIRDLSAKYSIMQGAMAALERIFNLLDTERDGYPSPGRRLPSPPWTGAGGEGGINAISFRDVWFAYKDEEYVLQGINLTIRRGEKVALVGETGGGKTTVTRLLSRLYDVSRGSISFDGTDIRELPLPELRRRIGVVLQEPYLFTGTIGFNISLGDKGAAARMEEAARLVGAARFIEALPKKYDEEVRERGVNLSAGERQLISFARAVAFDPEILVLDEATSSVDSESERLIQEGLQALMAGRTSLVVAHRLSTVQDADRIVVIHRGEKVEEGTHRELLAAGGVYARLHQLQFREQDNP
ncbi:ABC transporter ATP-binding protein/permease [Geobacter hydrogenophilus]|uniref:Xenobiotic ABC transporter ATP-binding protein n=1 Tax=Geobacter hydrogenophilus TaxID=40983 RepID=A0A9W6FZE8_9BACT|nr:ABC transporter ATP-binding protein [Geobacter hydrogenophilus]MBT0893395.1 ABC transporter ATP-binding protein/permease [Geobacter hydrogenophilus]GLI37910.1 xenobiotic ABC transporter ATP-binding protein [Geobacter hydrogenophilus]